MTPEGDTRTVCERQIDELVEDMANWDHETLLAHAQDRMREVLDSLSTSDLDDEWHRVFDDRPERP